jgi:hypothetical protein
MNKLEFKNLIKECVYEVKLEEQAEASIYEMFVLQNINENLLMEDDGGKIGSALKKAGLHVHKTTGLLGYLKNAGKGIMKLFLAAIKKDKEGVKQVLKSIRKEDVLDFLLKLDMATLHVISGPLHFIDAVSGYHLWAAVKEKASQGVNIIKQAIDKIKKTYKKVISPRIHKPFEKHLKHIELATGTVS